MQLPIDDVLDKQHRFYAELENQVRTLDPRSTLCLGNLEYLEDFQPKYDPPQRDGGFGKTVYVFPPKDDGGKATELSIVIFGEICPSAFGTAISAKGNHYAGTAEYPKGPITDDTIVKDVLVLRMLPGDTGEFLDTAWNNQVACLEEILDKDGAYDTPVNKVKPIPVTDWLASSQLDGGPNDRSLIKVTFGRKYDIPPQDDKSKDAAEPSPKKKRNLLALDTKPMTPEPTTPFDNSDDTMSDAGEVQDQLQLTVELGAFYDPDILPDHRGEYFKHVKAKLVQLDFKDEDDDLIPPWSMHDKLRPGTIVLVDATLVKWTIFGSKKVGKGRDVDRQVYQVQGHRLKVLRPSDCPVEIPTIPNLPQQSGQQQISFENSPRKKPSSAFSSFASPSKKPRLNI